MKFRIFFLCSYFLFLPLNLFPQTQTGQNQNKPKSEVNSQPQVAPKQEIPSWLGEFKKLDEAELAEKKEGWYLTGLPLFGEDPVAGRGLGAIGNLFYNGTKESPSFAYAPYEYLFTVSSYRTNRGTQNTAFAWDAPYFLDSPYRLRGLVGHDVSLNSQYFGFGSQSLQPLSYQNRNQPEGQVFRNARYPDYESANAFGTNRGPGREFVSTSRYHEYYFETTYSQFFVDKTIYKVFRIWGGTELSKNVVRRWDGTWTSAREPLTGISFPAPENTTKVTEDSKNEKIIGLEGGYLNYARGGIAYDTRDYEPDPDSGMLIEYTINRADSRIGSDYNYTRHTGQFKHFYQPFPKLFEEFVIAQRVLLTKVEGQVPFFEYRYLYTIDGYINALGGSNSLRGYRQERFMGPVTGFYNIEFRMRMGSFHLGSNFFQVSVVPFFDTGRVWDKLRQINTQGYLYSHGLGLRLVWDQATVIQMDWAVSREERLFYLDIGHVF